MNNLLMYLTGGGMKGGNLHHLLDGATFVDTVATEPRYRLWSVRDEFPGLQAVEGGAVVLGELYQVTYEILDRLLAAEPAELELGVVHLVTGFGSLAMFMRSEALAAPGLTDISDFGGWRAYRARLDKGDV
ncbi:gamma-glutamylcyclotransferase [Nonomuraea sp. NPDC026600]|uniref:allophanate hydrolase-related protein n=1 Tax=Nonomuraea sp. NPDC026600 TaxID=3155363 RepID=UPI0033D66107